MWSYQWIGPGARWNGNHSGVKSIRHKPKQVRQEQQQRDGQCQPGTGAGPDAAHARMQNREQQQGQQEQGRGVFAQQTERGQHAEPRPSAALRAPAAGLEAGAISGQSKPRPQRQQHDVVVELRREDREVDHAFLRQHGQQRALLPQHRAAETPHRDQRQCRGQRPHQVLRGRPAAGDGSDGFHDPRRQWRMLEIDDLPLAAPGELLDHVEGQVVLKQRRQQPPDQDVGREERPEDVRRRPALRQSGEALRECGPCQRGSKRRAIKPNMPQSSLDIASTDRNGAAPGIASDLVCRLTASARRGQTPRKKADSDDTPGATGAPAISFVMSPRTVRERR